MNDPRALPAARSVRMAVRLMIVLAIAGIAISAYLTATKLTGRPPACGPLIGCETVQSSVYSEMFGIPVAVFGLGDSALLLALAAGWTRLSRRRGLEVAYGLGLAGSLAIGYLTYLEIAVIGAICAWCVAYGLTVIGGWLAALAALRTAEPEGPSDAADRPGRS